MKHLLTLFFMILFVGQMTFAQSEGNHAITYKFVGVDTYSPYANLSDAGEIGFKFAARDAWDQMQPAVEVGYFYGVKDWLAIGAPFRMGKFRQRRDTLQSNPNAFSDVLFGSLDARAKISAVFKDRQKVIPYLSTGLGGMLFESREFDLQIPLQMGIDFRLARGFYIGAATEYRFSFDEIKDGDALSFTNSLFHSVGFTFVLGEEAETPPPPVIIEEEPEDTDGDGIVDEEDDCPEVAGLAAFNGCPDTDEDGIVDSEDDCPEVAGLEAFNGCPDTDSDGIADNNDDCPEEAGPESNNGCPLADRDNDGVNDADDNCPDTPGAAAFNGCPDTDGDGVADKDDKCPSVPGKTNLSGCPDADNDGVVDSADKCPTKAGPASNNGCPEIKEEDKATLNFAMKSVEFETGKNAIKTTSYKVLDDIAGLMAKYPDYSLSIGGHTDNVGADASNLALSEKRAKACFDYLVSKGVNPSRMSHAGYGETQPIADNSTKEGRQRNRRVEFRMFLR